MKLSKQVRSSKFGNQWPKLAHRTSRDATLCRQRGVLGEYSWKHCESFVSNVDTLFMLVFDHWQLYVLHFDDSLRVVWSKLQFFQCFQGAEFWQYHYQPEPLCDTLASLNSSFLVHHLSFFGKALSNYFIWQLWQLIVPWLLLTGLDVVLPGDVVHLCPFSALVPFSLLLQLPLCE